MADRLRAVPVEAHAAPEARPSFFQLMVGRRLRASRIGIGFDAATFAAELGLPVEAYREIETGRVEPGLEVLVTASRLTEKSLDFLITGRAFEPR